MTADDSDGEDDTRCRENVLDTHAFTAVICGYCGLTIPQYQMMFHQCSIHDGECDPETFLKRLWTIHDDWDDPNNEKPTESPQLTSEDIPAPGNPDPITVAQATTSDSYDNEEGPDAGPERSRSDRFR